MVDCCIKFRRSPPFWAVSDKLSPNSRGIQVQLHAERQRGEHGRRGGLLHALQLHAERQRGEHGRRGGRLRALQLHRLLQHRYERGELRLLQHPQLLLHHTHPHHWGRQHHQRPFVRGFCERQPAPPIRLSLHQRREQRLRDYHHRPGRQPAYSQRHGGYRGLRIPGHRLSDFLRLAPGTTACPQTARRITPTPTTTA